MLPGPPFDSLRESLLRTPRRQIHLDGFAPAAVLVPLLQAAGETTVLLTRRTDEVDTHKGQISFPGGMVEKTDADAEHAALREAEEELGLPPSSVTVVGLLDDHATPSGFIITPVVGVVRGTPLLVPNPREVAEVLRVPLAFFADTTNVRREQREFLGRMHDVWFYDTGTHVIWGATAAMIRSLLHRVGMLPPPGPS
jgi:8-oxo-dGTP pyrophosphatase MutT (NUDIX family)